MCIVHVMCTQFKLHNSCFQDDINSIPWLAVFVDEVHALKVHVYAHLCFIFKIFIVVAVHVCMLYCVYCLGFFIFCIVSCNSQFLIHLMLVQCTSVSIELTCFFLQNPESQITEALCHLKCHIRYMYFCCVQCFHKIIIMTMYSIPLSELLITLLHVLVEC